MYTVFIIDDEPYIRARLRELITWEELDFTIIGEASNGEDALQAILRLKPDLVLTDIRIPVFNGLELIRKIIPELPHCRFILLSGYSDFEYAREALKYGVKSYLLKPVGEMELRNAILDIKEELSKNRERDLILSKGMVALQEKWSSDVLNGINSSSLIARAEEMNIPVEGSLFTVFVIDWKEEESSSPEEIEDETLLRNTLVKQSIDEALSFHGNNFIIADDDDRYLILHMFPPGNVPIMELVELAEGIREKSSYFLEGDVTVGYSDTTNSILDVANCCTRAKVAIDGKFVLGRNRVIGFQDIARNIDSGNWNKIADFNRLALDEAIQELNMDAVRDETGKMFTVLRGLSHDPILIRGMIIENMMGIIRILIKINGDVREVFGESFKLDEWMDKHTLDELEKQFYGYCLTIMEYVTMVRKNRPGKVVEQMMDYITGHYSEDITLKSISRIFYMNPVYLGQLFKNEMGFGYHHYLTQIRIKAAKRMLDETDNAVSDIADKAGYKVVRNFYIAFKKNAGCTPNEYRSRV